MDQGRTKGKGRTRHPAPGTKDPIIDIRVIPRARKSEVAGIRDNAILVRLNAPPVDGTANAELIRLLAAVLEVPRRNIQIVSGERSRGKRVQISGRTAAEVERILSNPAEAGLHGNGQLSK
jgi:uncharacterized protein (TIGR00251 family)